MKSTTDKKYLEPHEANHASKLNWLRAAVLGANDGIVSIAGLVAGVAGALIPLVAMPLPPQDLRIPVAFISVIIALVITGTLSAKVGGASPIKATIRVVLGGVVAMVITYSIGRLFNVNGV